MTGQTQEQFDAMFEPEDLHPDLVPYVTDGYAGKMISHPLSIQVLYSPVSNKMINQGYIYKKKAVEDARKAGDWGQFVFLHERPYRIDALETVLFEEEITDKNIVWPLIARVWIDSENIWQVFDQWIDIWNTPDHDRSIFMEGDELATLDALPDVITVWRGVAHQSSVSGMSWSIDKEKAEWFARRWGGSGDRQPILVEGTIAKDDVLAYFSNRGESEIVAFPDSITFVKTDTL